jgi:hypothetical protein
LEVAVPGALPGLLPPPAVVPVPAAVDAVLSHPSVLPVNIPLPHKIFTSTWIWPGRSPAVGPVDVRNPPSLARVAGLAAVCALGPANSEAIIGVGASRALLMVEVAHGAFEVGVVPVTVGVVAVQLVDVVGVVVVVVLVEDVPVVLVELVLVEVVLVEVVVAPVVVGAVLIVGVVGVAGVAPVPGSVVFVIVESAISTLVLADT